MDQNGQQYNNDAQQNQTQSGVGSQPYQNFQQNNGNIPNGQPVYQQMPMYQQPVVNLPRKSKTTAGVLYLLLSDLGVGNFYMGKIGLGILDLVFCWTFVPAIVGFIRGIIILCESKESFEQKYRVISTD